jgi:hypothetical protein
MTTMEQTNKQVPAQTPTNEMLTLQGNVSIRLIGPDGKVKQAGEVKNMIMRVGMDYFAYALAVRTDAADGTYGPFNAIAIGTSSSAVANTQTALQGTELARGAVTPVAISNNVRGFTITFGAGTGTGTINEAALLNHSTTAGKMFSRVLTGAYVKGALDTLSITWTFTIGTWA